MSSNQQIFQPLLTHSVLLTCTEPQGQPEVRDYMSFVHACSPEQVLMYIQSSASGICWSFLKPSVDIPFYSFSFKILVSFVLVPTVLPLQIVVMLNNCHLIKKMS
jgi:hypothetical protein